MDQNRGEYIMLSVSDTGVGMDESLVDRIFEPFFTTKKPSEGTGMGLAMVHGAVRRHRGAINVSSSPGRGARFDIYFPRVPQKETTEQEESPTPRGAGEHVLLVDDEKDIVEAACQVLTRLGYRVTARSDSVAALETLRENPADFDLAIVDFALPDTSGVELADRFSRIRPDLPVLLITGFSGAIDRQELGSSGIREVLNKPLTSHEVGIAVRRVLR